MKVITFFLFVNVKDGHLGKKIILQIFLRAKQKSGATEMFVAVERVIAQENN
jgi:hypothetical protein